MITNYIATMWSASALGGSLFASIFPNVSDLMADATFFSMQSSIGASLQSRPPLKAAWAGRIRLYALVKVKSPEPLTRCRLICEHSLCWCKSPTWVPSMHTCNIVDAGALCIFCKGLLIWLTRGPLAVCQVPPLSHRSSRIFCLPTNEHR